MSVQIQIQRQEVPFLMTPHEASSRAGKDFSLAAFGALVAILALPNGSMWSVKQLQTRLGVGKSAWDRITRELRAVGAVWDCVSNDPRTGRISRVIAFGWPGSVVPDEGRWKRREAGFPTDGKTARKVVKKPCGGKPASRSAQVIEIVDENEPRECENSGQIKKKEAEGGGLQVAKPTEALSPPSDGKAETALPDDEGRLSRPAPDALCATGSEVVAGTAKDPVSRAAVAAITAAFVARSTGPCASGAGTVPGSTGAENEGGRL